MIHPRNRTGAALLDAVVAAMLVMVTLAFATPMVVRSARIWKQTRNFQIASDELSSQMDVLVAMPSGQRRQALENITVHPEVSPLLQDATIEAKLVENEQDTRLRLSINWKRVGNPPPLTLVAWVKPIDEITTSEESAKTSKERAEKEKTDEPSGTPSKADSSTDSSTEESSDES